MIRLYLAGPMRGVEDLNYPEFDRVARILRQKNYGVFNPAEADRTFKRKNDREPTRRECFETDTQFICQKAEGIALLDGWIDSLGAKAEVALGAALGIPIREWKEWLPT